MAFCRVGSRRLFGTGIAVALWDDEAISLVFSVEGYSITMRGDTHTFRPVLVHFWQYGFASSHFIRRTEYGKVISLL